MAELTDRALLAEDGIIFDQAHIEEVEKRWKRNYNVAFDAQPALQTAANAGIPYFLASTIDPEVIDVLYAPVKVAMLAGGEKQRGSWTDIALQIPLAEPTCNVVSYGDFENGGSSDSNIEYVPRQPYHYQTIKRVGEKQLAQWGLAAIDYSAQLDKSIALGFSKFRNQAYAYGIAGLQNYGLLNDPGLNPAIAPLASVSDANHSLLWKFKTVEERARDVIALFQQLQSQLAGNADMTDKLILGISPKMQPMLRDLTNMFLRSGEEGLKAAFENLEIITVPELETPSGETLIMIAPQIDGIDSIWPCYTELYHAHNTVNELSSYAQKISAGVTGCITRRYAAVATMIGIG